VRRAGFTLTETMVAMAVGSTMLAGLLVTSTSLQRWFSSAESLIGTQQDEAAIFDYLARDIRRASACAISNAGPLRGQCLTLTMPDQTARAADHSLLPPAFTQAGIQYGTTNTTVSYYLKANGILVRDDPAGETVLSTAISTVPADKGFTVSATSSVPGPPGSGTVIIGPLITIDLVFAKGLSPSTTPRREVTTSIRWRNYPGFVQ
jgi:prepilin-type N-terminal cleavage/methylation domain-containing protein